MAKLETQKNSVLYQVKQKRWLPFSRKKGFALIIPSQQSSRSPYSKYVKEKKVHLRLFVKAAIFFVVLSGILLGLNYFLKNHVSVLDFTTWKLSDVRIWAKNNNLILREDTRYNDQYESDRVVSQDVKKGTFIKKNGFVGVVISKGHDPSVEIPVPNFISMTNDGIDDWVKQNFMTGVTVTAQYSESAPMGTVLSYEIDDPSVVDKVRRDTVINFIVSKGKMDPNAMAVSVPDFTGKSINDCMEFTNKSGVNLQVKNENNDWVSAGTIIRQSVLPEDKIKPGETFVVTISLGKAVLIPDFSQYSKQEASTEAQKQGITVSITERYGVTPLGQLISQSIAPSETYEAGESVSLVYSLGNQVAVGSFVGQAQSAIDAWVNGVNAQGAAITIKKTYTQNDATLDKILSQNKKNVMVDLDATISITVSQGMNVQVPDFVAPSGSPYGVAITMEKAMTVCEQLGLVPVFEESKKSGRLPGEVWSQSISAGKRVSQGTTITFKYTPNTQIFTVPDFSGMTQQAIHDAGYDKKLSITFKEAGTPVDGYDDTVCKQSISKGTKVSYGSEITLTVSPSESP